MAWLKFSASVVVIAWAVVANFEDVALPDGGTVGTRWFGQATEAPPVVRPVRAKPKPGKDESSGRAERPARPEEVTQAQRRPGGAS
jgi:hypothetical protein